MRCHVKSELKLTLTTPYKSLSAVMLYPGDRVRLPSGREGRFVRWMVDRVDREKGDVERVACVQLDGDTQLTRFSERYAASWQRRGLA